MTFNEKEYELFKKIAEMNQFSLMRMLSKFLRRHYDKDKIILTDKYLCAEGTVPIALVAHLDTYHWLPATNIFWDRKEDVVWCMQGLGADDRAGVFSIIKIIQHGYTPHIIFTTDEEIGGKGAAALARQNGIFKDLKYCIELDREGANDCVFYLCGNNNFMKYVESFGFEKDEGTYTDLCEICPVWDVAGVNLSVGYFEEHRLSEILIPSLMFDTIKKVEKMLDDADNAEYFKFMPIANTEYYYNQYFIQKGMRNFV